MKRSRLTKEERQFFSLVNRSVVSNPFSDERVELELSIAGLYPAASKMERIYKTIREVDTRLGHLTQENRDSIACYTGRDRDLVKKAYLFSVFSRYRKQFDQLIAEQLQEGDTPLKVPFAREAIATLRERGFDREESLRYFALCYQLRRAYFFIGRSLVGASPVMKKLRRDLWNAVFTHNIDLYDTYLWNRMEDFSTLILGETGTGKGTAAMAIGRSGFIPFDEEKGRFVESFTRSFVPLNLSQFPEALIESELFGHKKGAFTGAVEDYEGIFNRCSPYGSIFLDEIGEVSTPIQIKLLQVLQERAFSPVGSQQRGRFQGRVIAATNRPLDEIREKGVFRDDFYYRLCSDVIVIPPLRRRIAEAPDQEIDGLLTHTVERMVGRPSPEFTAMVRRVIDENLGDAYPWPGNVRELEQCARRVLLKGNYEGDRRKKSAAPSSDLAAAMERGELDAQGLLSGYCRHLYRRHNTYEEVARRTGLDRRTVKKYIVAAKEPGS